VFLLLDPVEQRIDGKDVATQRIGRHLPVQHLCADVRIVGGKLAPALSAALAGDANEADESVGECLETRDPHIDGIARPWRRLVA
jgi:hypothetical protein